MSAQPFATLAEWLAHLERLHPKSIALGLERVAAVRRALQLTPDFPVITVGGTNGKGSTCAYLEAMLTHGGYRTGCYTSPHFVRYNERVRIGQREAGDAELCEAFARIEAVRGDVPLTYFEFGTLAAMQLFARAGVGVAVLEVGLGGRLDAVNAFDADCAVVTSVALDHMDYLGTTREQIGFEKAGIFRAGRPAVCADPDPPRTLLDEAERIGARLLRIGADFGYSADRQQWRYRGPGGGRHGLPLPVLRGEHQFANASAAIAALDELKARVPVGAQDIRNGLVSVELSGRFQVLPGRPLTVLDVAHNPHAAHALARMLAGMGRARTFAVFAMLRDKDIAGVVDAVRPCIDRWLVADIHDARGASAAQLCELLERAGVAPAAVEAFATPAAAYRHACDRAVETDRIVVFGSFHTVADVLRERGHRGT